MQISQLQQIDERMSIDWRKPKWFWRRKIWRGRRLGLLWKQRTVKSNESFLRFLCDQKLLWLPCYWSTHGVQFSYLLSSPRSYFRISVIPISKLLLFFSFFVRRPFYSVFSYWKNVLMFILIQAGCKPNGDGYMACCLPSKEIPACRQRKAYLMPIWPTFKT